MWISLTDCVLSCFCLQVLQYNVEAGTWTQIGKLQKSRASHAITEVNLAAVCPVGNLNPVKKKQNHQYHYHQGTTCPNLFKSAIGNPNPN